MSFARGMDPAIADRFVGMWVNEMTVDCGERGRRAVQALLDRGHAAGDHPERGCESTSWTPDRNGARRPPLPRHPASRPGRDSAAARRARPAPCVVAVGHSECGTTRLAVPYLVTDAPSARAAGDHPSSSCCRTTPDAARAFLADLRADAAGAARGRPVSRWRGATGLATVPTLFLVSPAGRDRSGPPKGSSAPPSRSWRDGWGWRRRSSPPGTTAPALRPG